MDDRGALLLMAAMGPNARCPLLLAGVAVSATVVFSLVCGSAVRLGRLLSEQANVLARGLLLVRQLGRACAVLAAAAAAAAVAGDADVRQVQRRLLVLPQLQ